LLVALEHLDKATMAVLDMAHQGQQTEQVVEVVGLVA
jgi:hypothetical protein